MIKLMCSDAWMLVLIESNEKGKRNSKVRPIKNREKYYRPRAGDLVEIARLRNSELPRVNMAPIWK